jgi:hypothetical protein
MYFPAGHSATHVVPAPSPNSPSGQFLHVVSVPSTKYWSMPQHTPAFMLMHRMTPELHTSASQPEHSAELAAPTVPTYVPCGQAVHAVSEPSTENFPRGHDLHVVSTPSTKYLPGPQQTFVLEEVHRLITPVPEQVRLVVHDMQLVESVDPAALYVPTPHALHALSPSALYIPALHGWHSAYRIRIRPEPPAPP